MIKKITVALLLAFSVAVQAQSGQADQLLNNLLNSARTSAIRTNFKLDVTVKADPTPQSSSGSFTLKGTKFTLDLPQMKVWFNGKTQWAYSAENNEVTVTEPTEKELAETNPLAIIAGFRAKSTVRMAAKNKNAQINLIEMIPQNRKSEITKIEISLNKANGNPVMIKTSYFNGSVSVLKLANFQKGVSVTDNTFTFNQSHFRGVNINDLR